MARSKTASKRQKQFTYNFVFKRVYVSSSTYNYNFDPSESLQIFQMENKNSSSTQSGEETPASEIEIMPTNKITDTYVMGGMGRSKGKKTSSYYWSFCEQKRYLQALNKLKDLFLLTADERRLNKLNVKISKIIRTRSPQQCHSHHQKMFKKHKSIQEIIQHLSTLQEESYLQINSRKQAQINSREILNQQKKDRESRSSQTQGFSEVPEVSGVSSQNPKVNQKNDDSSTNHVEEQFMSWLDL